MYKLYKNVKFAKFNALKNFYVYFELVAARYCIHNTVIATVVTRLWQVMYSQLRLIGILLIGILEND